MFATSQVVHNEYINSKCLFPSTEYQNWLSAVNTMWQRWHLYGFFEVIIIITLQMWIFQDDCILSGWLAGWLKQKFIICALKMFFHDCHSRSLYPNALQMPSSIVLIHTSVYFHYLMLSPLKKISFRFGWWCVLHSYSPP